MRANNQGSINSTPLHYSSDDSKKVGPCQSQRKIVECQGHFVGRNLPVAVADKKEKQSVSVDQFSALMFAGISTKLAVGGDARQNTQSFSVQTRTNATNNLQIHEREGIKHVIESCPQSVFQRDDWIGNRDNIITKLSVFDLQLFFCFL
mmetsp:Transcript_56173/g.117499  ORF Transcript_56173/g.117499 Transcript_56173/m.117499 type:complete len:149 (+) Transcript_56173:212-658(+)